MKKLNQSGAVSLLSVVIFAIIISVVVTAYVRNIIVQHRESFNYDLSTRAFYAAEAGVQDAIRALKQNGAEGNALKQNGRENACKGPLGGDGSVGESDGSLGYTCQLIDADTNTVFGAVNSETDLLKLKAPNGGGALKVTLKWGNDSNNSQVPRPGDSKLLPSVNDWKNGDGQTYPVMMRTSLISVQNGLTNRDGIKQNVYFLNPTGSGQGDISNVTPGTQDNNISASESVIHNSICGESVGLECSQSFIIPGSVFSGKTVYIALQAIYAESGGDTSYEITTVENATSQPVAFDGLANIDATGKAGDVFRRVKQQVSIKGTGAPAFFESSVSADALIAGDGLCKLFTVGTSENQYRSFCNPLSSSP